MAGTLRIAFAVALAIGPLGCSGRPTPGTVRIGIPRYDDFFRATNAVLVAAQSDGAAPRQDNLRERARVLGAEALALLETVDRDIDKPEKRERVKRALREAAERLAAVN